MPITNVDFVTVNNEDDLTLVNSVVDFIHVTKGKKITPQDLAAQILSELTAQEIRDLLHSLTVGNRINANFIDGLTDTGTPTTVEFTNKTSAFLTVPGMTNSPSYLAVYIEGDRVSSTRYTASANTITFNPILIEEDVIIDYKI